MASSNGGSGTATSSKPAICSAETLKDLLEPLARDDPIWTRSVLLNSPAEDQWAMYFRLVRLGGETMRSALFWLFVFFLCVFFVFSFFVLLLLLFFKFVRLVGQEKLKLSRTVFTWLFGAAHICLRCVRSGGNLETRNQCASCF